VKPLTGKFRSPVYLYQVTFPADEGDHFRAPAPFNFLTATAAGDLRLLPAVPTPQDLQGTWMDRLGIRWFDDQGPTLAGVWAAWAIGQWIRRVPMKVVRSLANAEISRRQADGERLDSEERTAVREAWRDRSTRDAIPVVRAEPVLYDVVGHRLVVFAASGAVRDAMLELLTMFLEGVHARPVKIVPQDLVAHLARTRPLLGQIQEGWLGWLATLAMGGAGVRRGSQLVLLHLDQEVTVEGEGGKVRADGDEAVARVVREYVLQEGQDVTRLNLVLRTPRTTWEVRVDALGQAPKATLPDAEDLGRI